MGKIQLPFVRSPYNYDPIAACEECCVPDFGPSLTQQSQAEEADINTIVKRFGLTGRLPENTRIPTYQDFEGVFDFQTAQNAVIQAQEAFMRIPPGIRARFDNDPQTFLEYASNPENIDGLRELGLAKPKAAEEGITAGPANNGGPTAPDPKSP